VQLEVATNTRESRSGTATIAGQTFTIVQAGCTATVSPTYQLIPPIGAVGGFEVNTISACPWTAVPSASWIRIISGGSGAGVGTVVFVTEPNRGPARNGTIDVLNQKFLVQQEAVGTPTLSRTETAGGMERRPLTANEVATVTATLDPSTASDGARAVRWRWSGRSARSSCRIAWSPSRFARASDRGSSPRLWRGYLAPWPPSRGSISSCRPGAF
jgi:hypothetical protein